LALADPEAVPAGVYARRWLEGLGLWGALAPRVVPGVSVRDALSTVLSGSVELGIVYASEVRASSLDPRRSRAAGLRVVWEVPASEAPEIRYLLCRLDSAPATLDLVERLTSPAALAVFERYGFIAAPLGASVGERGELP
jgi:molybdate transport system substrate-binding protein